MKHRKIITATALMGALLLTACSTGAAEIETEQKPAEEIEAQIDIDEEPAVTKPLADINLPNLENGNMTNPFSVLIDEGIIDEETAQNIMNYLQENMQIPERNDENRPEIPEGDKPNGENPPDASFGVFNPSDMEKPDEQKQPRNDGINEEAPEGRPNFSENGEMPPQRDNQERPSERPNFDTDNSLVKPNNMPDLPDMQDIPDAENRPEGMPKGGNRPNERPQMGEMPNGESFGNMSASILDELKENGIITEKQYEDIVNYIENLI